MQMIPGEITFAFCTPTTLDGYRAHMLDARLHHYARMVSPKEADFADVVIRPYEQFIEAIGGLGAKIALSVNLAAFGALLAEPQCRCLILIAHWHEEQVEFFDGLTDFCNVVAAVPQRFEGILDLSICNAKPLALALRKAHPELGPIKFSTGPVNYAFWLIFYERLLRRIAGAPMDYWDAHEAVMRDFLAIARRR
ncbi:MAG TPA: hypothetical protein VNV61_07475 [Steroidobacteraceae bacterium]|nr:hypothetical protein [Steroidobacteraceae bacterium]